MKLCLIPRHNQITAIEVACSNGLPECIEMATKMYATWMNSNNTNKYGHYWISIYHLEFELSQTWHMILLVSPTKWSRCNSFQCILWCYSPGFSKGRCHLITFYHMWLCVRLLFPLCNVVLVFKVAPVMILMLRCALILNHTQGRPWRTWSCSCSLRMCLPKQTSSYSYFYLPFGISKIFRGNFKIEGHWLFNKCVYCYMLITSTHAWTAWNCVNAFTLAFVCEWKC